MSGQAFEGTKKRTFREALLGVLFEGYGLLGSRRICETLADDVQRMVEKFYPPSERLGSGWMVFTGTKAVGGKAMIAQDARDHELVSIAWPVLTPDDIQQMAEGLARKRNEEKRQAWYQKRLIRILEHGWNHPDGPVVLTLADLSCMLGIPQEEVSALLKQARDQSGKPLLTKGYYFDQGLRPTHKDMIIALYEQGCDEADIAKRTQHSPQSVGSYIRDYERVKLLISRQTPIVEIGMLVNLQPSVVKAYVEMLKKYHEDLFQDQGVFE
jgi:hypothetical protein